VVFACCCRHEKHANEIRAEYFCSFSRSLAKLFMRSTRREMIFFQLNKDKKGFKERARHQKGEHEMHAVSHREKFSFLSAHNAMFSHLADDNA
jgi:hypothetical protein